MASPVTIDVFCQQVVDSGLMTVEDLTPHKNACADAEQLARRLVKQKLLTAFQAQQIYAGKGRALVLGNYRILDKLGEGGMGMVLKAEHLRMKRLVALKVLSPKVVKNPEAVARFHREVEAAARLEHANIVPAYDADEANGTHFFVMQYIEGQDLAGLVRSQGPLPVDRAVNYILQAGKGLDYAHKRGVIHRDIKPANLLLDKEGTVKILDMGLARIEGETGANAELTSTGAVMGTVDYMAPEQAMSTKSADARSDIYSLGVTLWYLLKGKPLFDGDSLMARLMGHREAPIPALFEGPDDPLNAVFRKMVAKRPEDRFQSLSEVIAALETLRLESTTAAISVSGLESPATIEFSSGTRRAAATMSGSPAATAVAAPVSPAETPTLVSGIHAEPAADQTLVSPSGSGKRRGLPGAARTKSNPKQFLGPVAGGAVILLAVVGVYFAFRTRTETVAPGSQAVAEEHTVAAATRPEPIDTPRVVVPPAVNPVNHALRFDGNGAVEFPTFDFDATQPLTVEAWVNLEPTDRDRAMITLTAPNQRVKIQQGAVKESLFQFGASLGQESPSDFFCINHPQPIPQRWVHVAICRRSADEFEGFVDGVPTGRQPWRLNNTTATSTAFMIGKAGGPTLLGEIDEVRISRGVRYDGPFTPERRFETDEQTIALYHFDEGAGAEVYDASGNDFHGKMSGARWVRTNDPGTLGFSPARSIAVQNALQFDGVDDYVTIPTLVDQGGPSTVEALVRTTRLQNASVIVGGGRSKKSLYAYENGFGFHSGNPEAVGTREILKLPTSNSFRHVAGVWNGREVQLFVDGQPASTPEVPKADEAGPSGFFLGAEPKPGSKELYAFFAGEISEVRFSRTSRYTQAFTVPHRLEVDTDTLALYHFEEGTGDVLKDSSGNNHHGQIVGAKWVAVTTERLPHIKTEELSSQHPPLEEWLKGRQVLTVSQDGSAMFTTIQAALDAQQNGQVVQVLDRGPYRESLSWRNKTNCGLITTVGTIVEVTEWKLSRPGYPDLLGHSLARLVDCRLHGFTLLSNPKGEQPHFSLHAYDVPSLCVEHCVIAISSPVPDSADIRVQFNAISAGSAEGQRPFCLRNCISTIRVGVTLPIDTTSAAEMYHNWILLDAPAVTAGLLSLGTRSVPGRVTIEQNVLVSLRSNEFGTGFGGKDGITSMSYRHNTLMLPTGQAHSTQFNPGPNFAIEDNLYLLKYASVSFYNDALAFLPEARERWKIARNYSTGEPQSGNQHLPLIQPATQQPIRVLSTDPLDRNYLRVDPASITIPPGDPFPGALPPGPAPAEGDWFTRLQDRWRATQEVLTVAEMPAAGKVNEPESQHPPLEEWLKGRQVLTVSQDGSAMFTTIQAALDAQQNGQVVRVLDRGPYRESLSWRNKTNCGLVTTVGTIVEVAEWKPLRQDYPELLGHSFGYLVDCRFHGFTLLSSPESIPGCFPLSCYNVPALCMEHCVISLSSSVPDLANVGVQFNFDKLSAQKHRPFCLRNCISTMRVAVRLPFDAATAVEVHHNWFLVGASAQDSALLNLETRNVPGRVTIEQNILTSLQPWTYGAAFSGKDGVTNVDYRHNTLMIPTGQAQSTGNNPGPNFAIEDNLYLLKYASASFYNDSFPFQAEARERWKIARNYSTGEPRSGNQHLPLIQPATQQPIRVLSTDPLDRNYLRVDPASITIPPGDPFPGALPPGPAPAAGDWFTRLQDRWRATLDDL